MNEIIEVQARTPEIIVGEILATYNQVRRFALEGAVIIGNNLKDLKELVPHGGWTDYIEDNLGMSARKAQQYIQLANEYGKDNSPYFQALASKPQLIADLNFSTALRLLSIPEEDLEEVIPADEAVSESIDLEAKIEEYKNDTAKLQDQLAQVTAQMEMLRISASDVDKKNEELGKLESKAKKLEGRINVLEREKLEAAAEAAEKARKEAIEEAKKAHEKNAAALLDKVQEAEDRAERAERQLQNLNSEVLARFKVHVDNLQGNLNEVKACIREVAAKDPAKADKMMTNVWRFINDIMEAE